MTRIRRIGLAARGTARRPMRPIRHLDAAWLAVQLEEHGDHALVVGRAHRLVDDHQRLALFQVDKQFLTSRQAVEIIGRRKHRHRTVGLGCQRIVGEDLRIHEIGGELEVADLAADLLFDRLTLGIEVGVLKQGAGPDGIGRFALQRLLLQTFRPADRRLAEIAAQHGDDRFREGHVLLWIDDVLDGQVLAHHHQRHVAHDLGRRRHLDDVAEHLVGVGIGLRHFVPAGFQPERAGLFLEIGELAARHFMQVDFRGRPLEIALEGRILVAHGFPVEGEPADPVRIEPGIALGAAQRLDDRPEAGLRSIAREAVHCRIDGVDAGLDGGQHRCRRDARRVVGVEMDRQAGRLAQRLEQDLGRGRLQEARHVLDRDDVRAGLFQFGGERCVIFQVVFRPGGIEDIAGIADRRLAELVLLGDRVHRDAHVLHPVEAVEHTEEVDAASRSLADEVLHHVVGIVLVADAVGAAQQHLQKQVRCALADQRETLPRVFGEEAHGDVEGRTAPAFERQQVGQSAGIGAGGACDVMGAHAGGQQRLVAVAHRRVGDQHAGLAAHPFGELDRPEPVEHLLGAVRDRRVDIGDDGLGRIFWRTRTTLGFRMAIDGDVGEIGQKLGRAVLALDLGEQFRRRIDEARRVAVVAELRVADDRLEEGEVGGDPADAEFTKRPVHALDRLLRRRRPGGDLFQQRIIVAGDHRAGIGRAAVKPDAEAGRAAIGRDAAVIRDEVLLRIFGGDAALKGMAVEANVLLLRHARFRRTDGMAVEDVDLRLDDVDAGHDLGDGVLDLDARIDLDEVELAGVGIHQIFDRAGADIVRRLGDLQRIVRKFLALGVAEIGRRGPLDDLLVAALDRAVALEQVHDIAVRVAEDLAFHVAGALDQLFQIDLVLAEGGHGLALGLDHFAGEILRVADGAHAATAAAPRCLQHHRIADRFRHAGDFRHVVRQRLGRRNNRNPDGNRQVAGSDLVAELAHGLGARADEGNAGLVAGIDEFRAFRQQAVAGMDRIRARKPGDADHFVDRKIAFDRPELTRKMRTATDLVAFVRLEAVQRKLVLLGPDRDRLQPEFVGGAEDANGNFGSVGNENL